MLRKTTQLAYTSSTTEKTITLSDSIENYKMISVRASWGSDFRGACDYVVNTFANLKYKQRLYFGNDSSTGHYVEYCLVDYTTLKILTDNTSTNIQIVGIK